MNRRGFIATLTAIAGAALAKIKAPAAPTLRTAAALVTIPIVRTDEPLYGFAKLSGGTIFMNDRGAFDSYGQLVDTGMFKPWPPGTSLAYMQTSDGKYRWVPVDKS